MCYIFSGGLLNVAGKIQRNVTCFFSGRFGGASRLLFSDGFSACLSVLHPLSFCLAKLLSCRRRHLDSAKSTTLWLWGNPIDHLSDFCEGEAVSTEDAALGERKTNDRFLRCDWGGASPLHFSPPTFNKPVRSVCAHTVDK